MEAAEHDFDHLIGTTIDGRYEVESLLGYGGMGGVFRATHTGLRRAVALKVLRSTMDTRGEAAKRFEREAYSASRLDHPNCARVHDFGTLDSGDKYLVMELVEGSELEDLIGTPWPPARAAELSIQILRGLAHAHSVGIVHRDLKPANVLVRDDEQGKPTAKLVDFGIAKILDDDVFDEKLTRTGIVFGTPRYMSPEQASGGKIDARTDIYAAGLILYQLLAGHPPFQAQAASELLRMHIIVPPPPLPDTVPPALAQVAYRMLEKSPKDRFPTADAAAVELERLLPSLGGASAAIAPVSAGDATAAVPVPAPVPVPVPVPSAPTATTAAVHMPATAPHTAPMPTQPTAPGATMPVYGPTGPTTAVQRPARATPWIIAAIAGGIAVVAVLALLLMGGNGSGVADDTEGDGPRDQDTAGSDAAAASPAPTDEPPGWSKKQQKELEKLEKKKRKEEEKREKDERKKKKHKK